MYLRQDMWKLSLCVIFLHIGFSDGLLGIGSSQSVDVQGTLTCNGQPASGILVKLYDSNTLTIDNLLATGNTDSNGGFDLTGKINDITSMDPKVDIFHNCDNSALVS
uniref:Transthyretin-like family protein n=1 Tax=Acrobeloides nanus TaxID=290746 RepID=A0A914D227_9BILA